MSQPMLNPATLLGLKEDVVSKLLSRLGMSHKVEFRDGKAIDRNKLVKVKSNVLVLTITQGVVTNARNLL